MASKITKGSDAKENARNIAKEAISLESSSVVTLYEIDASELDAVRDLGTEALSESVLRFHNIEVLNQTVIYFKGDAYHPIPIITDGFEMSSTGSLPRPTITFTSIKAIQNLEDNNHFASLKKAILELNNLIGAKVTRLRTYVKFLDSTNTSISGVGQHTTSSNPEFPREIYFVERKVAEDKASMQFELASVIDMETFQLPSRLCLANRCPWTYRGEGCCYEFKTAGSADAHGATGHLPDYAPPIANEDDELLSTKVAGYDPYAVSETTPTEYNFNKVGGYSSGDIVYVVRNDIRYYYIAKVAVPAQTGPPPNTNYWEADRCSKSLTGCKLRWGNSGAAKNGSTPSSSNTAANKFLPFGGFPGTNTKMVVQ